MRVAFYQTVYETSPWAVVNTSVQSLVDTPRTVPYKPEELEAMDKTTYTKIKDVGFYIVGQVNGRQAVERDGIVLDLDSDDAVEQWCAAQEKLGYTWAAHPTLSSERRGNGRRWRVIIPLSRPVLAEEYTTIAASFVEYAKIGGLIDQSCLRPNQPMFLPAKALGETWTSTYHEGVVFDPDTIPRVEITAPLRSGLPDPRTKSGTIGAFNSAYTIEEAIEAFGLPYTKTSLNAWTYNEGTTKDGLKIYDDGLYAFSFHGTDPAGDGHCHSAFDLVVAHKGYQETVKLLSTDERTVSQKVKSVLVASHALPPDEGMVVRDYLPYSTTARGTIEKTIDNVWRCLTNEGFVDGLWEDERSKAMLVDSLPWRKVQGTDDFYDADVAQLCRAVELAMGGQTIPVATVKAALAIWGQEHSKNPLVDKLSSLEWDGVERLDTLVVDCLAAENTELNRAMTRAWCIGAIRRAYEPGCKMDSMLILQGAEGIGKTWLGERLAFGSTSGWLATGVRTLDDKDAHMLAARAWIVELGELSAVKRSDREIAKQFLTETVSNFRPPYSAHVLRVPRSCVFIGQTNDTVFLDPEPGNRRFWVIRCNADAHDASRLVEKDDYYFEQVWAEAVQAYLSGESCFLQGQLVKDVIAKLDEVTDQDELVPVYRSWLDSCDEKKVCMNDCLARLPGGTRTLALPSTRRRIRLAMSKIDGWEPRTGTNLKCSCGLHVSQLWVRKRQHGS